MSDQDMEILIRDFAATKGLKVAELKGHNRVQQLTQPRMELYYLLRGHGVSFSRIAWHLGRRDHSTVIYGVRKYRQITRNRPPIHNPIYSRVQMVTDGAGL